MAKKPNKTKEELASERFFPIDQSSLRKSVEKLEKDTQETHKQTIEKIYKSQIENPVELIKTTKIRKSQPRRKFKVSGPGKKPEFMNKKNSGAKFKPVDSYKPQKISLNPEGYELIITEKPQAAAKIADALGSVNKKNFKGVPYYDVNRDGEKIIVACAVGHLFTLAQNTPGSNFPVFDIKWVPNFYVRKQDFSKKYYDAMSNLVRGASSLTVATDYDIEGEVIGLNIVKYICGQKDASRMKFSTLTPVELNKAYEEKSPTLNWGQAIAGETRHYLDWFYGINLSRALMNALKSIGKFKIMSIGRVQGPTLNFIVKKEREIQSFKSKPYWEVFITVKNKHVVELKHNKEIFNKKELSKFDNLKGKTVIATTKKSSENIEPNPPFNLTSLQTEAYKFYGLTPSKTLQIAQSLYLDSLISYPRTSSQKLPPSIGYNEILEKIAKEFRVEHLIKRKTPIEGKKSDPAHPSIYPTGNTQILTGDQEKIYNLIAKRFLSLFCEDAIIDSKKISVNVDDLDFSLRGSTIRKKGWMDIYPTKLKTEDIPDVEGEVKIINSRIEEKETQPPKRYSPASIVSELEKRNIGTKATRSSILETLYDRDYIKDQSIKATSLGMSLIETLEKYSPIIIDEKLTRSFENQMDSIIESKKDIYEKESSLIEKAKETITSISKDFGKHEKDIGNELLKANTELREVKREENKVVLCPKCKKGFLSIIYSKKNRRQFIACNSYPECKNTYSLPPNGFIKKAEKDCEECTFPMLMRIQKGKSPWIFCFNPECIKNRERVEKYRNSQVS
ncbi:MAG: DNA topoisomerase I [Nanoarchaeota archaeon]